MIRIKSIKIDDHLWTGGTQSEFTKFLRELCLSTEACAQPQTSIGVGTVNLRNVETVTVTLES
jgi:hypothetical protein